MRLHPEMSRSKAALLAFLLLSLAFVPAASAQFTSSSLTLTVYADGSARVTQVLSANSSAVLISVQLLSPVLSDAVAVDQGGSPLSFQISGSNITIYTLGSTRVTLQYDTDALTSKQGTVWTLSFDSSYSATAVLPVGSMVTLVSGAPTSVSQENGSPVVTVPAGTWQISYGVPISIGTTSSTRSSTSGSATSSGSSASSGSGASTRTTASSTSSKTSGTGLTYQDLAAVLLVAAAIVAAALLLRRQRTRSDVSGLRPDDVNVLNYIAGKGGKVFEPDLRTGLALPKTTAWRQVKRLERLGYVRITMVGSQNQIELLKNREKPSA